MKVLHLHFHRVNSLEEAFRMSRFIFIFIVFFGTQAFSKGLMIEVGKAGSKKSKVAFSPFMGTSAIDKNTVESLISRNLEFSTYFDMVTESSLKNLDGSIDKEFSKKLYASGIEFLIAPSTTQSKAQNASLVQFKVYFLKTFKLAFDKIYSGDSASIANKFSDDFMEKLTGTKSIFNTKIVATSDRVGGGWKEIYTMNWDGSDIKRQSYHKASSMSPNWSPGGNQIVYSAITVQPKKGVRSANLYVYDFRTKRRSMLSSRPGINSGGSFFPDGRHLAMTLTQGGVPDIFKIALDGSIKDRLTKGPGRTMNVEASVSPDGKRLAFSSDRSGKPMLYTMSLSAKKPKRLTFAGRYNSLPSWSPDGKSLVFAGWADGHFDVFTIDANGGNLKRITQKRRPNGTWANNESPSFSPDGRFISFISNRTGRKEIYIIRADGTNITPITTKDRYNYYHATWSPFLN